MLVCIVCRISRATYRSVDGMPQRRFADSKNLALPIIKTETSQLALLIWLGPSLRLINTLTINNQIIQAN